jgi:hypothetical protein
MNSASQSRGREQMKPSSVYVRIFRRVRSIAYLFLLVSRHEAQEFDPLYLPPSGTYVIESGPSNHLQCMGGTNYCIYIGRYQHFIAVYCDNIVWNGTQWTDDIYALQEGSPYIGDPERTTTVTRFGVISSIPPSGFVRRAHSRPITSCLM